jgi:signal transduction histidine kinase
MDFRFSFEGRTERLIAVGRVVLASFSFLVIWLLDPSSPVKYPTLAYVLLVAYVVYALIVTFLVWASYGSILRLRLITHVLDLGMFSLFMYFTEGPTSPFFLYFIFSILCATLRWQWRGTFWTAVVALTAFLGMGVYASEILKDPAFDLDTFVIRSVYLGMVAGLIGYLGAYESQRRTQLSKLAAWPRTPLLEVEKVVNQVLEQARSICGAPRVLLAWEESEEPWLQVVMLSDDGLQWSRKPPGSFNPIVAVSLEGKSFFSQDVRTSTAVVVEPSSSEVRRWHGEPLNGELERLFNVKSVLSSSLLGENIKGRLFFLDKSSLTSDDLVLADVVAGQAAVSMDLFYLLRRLQQLAAMEERIRLARDLHDGVLQSLTATALQLQAALQILEANPGAVREQLREIQDLIVQEQRDLRSFVEELKLATLAPSEPDLRLGQLLEQLGKMVERQWGLRVELRIVGSESWVPAAMGREIYHIVREGLINAARHSQASVAQGELQVEDHQIRISVSDNGRGFPFRGYYDQTALTSMGLGPTMLKSRIAFLGGSLNIHSAESGSRLEITLPLSRHGS